MDLSCLKRLFFVKEDKKKIRIGRSYTVVDFVSSEGLGI
jgi:hypothetical protein